MKSFQTRPAGSERVYKPSRIVRIVRALTILQSGEQLSADDLAKMLGVSRRTFFRDLKDLRKAGVPCLCDKKTHYYKIAPEFFLPSPDLSSQEALALLLLVHKTRNLVPRPFEDLALMAALKIENNLPVRVKRYCNNALCNISIKTNPQAEMNLLDNAFAQFQKAILNKRVVEICYYLPSQKKTVTTNLSPYHLIRNNYVWHVIGKSSLHRGICTFKLNQIKELNILDKCFTKEKRFDVFEYLGRAWSIVPEGRLYHVKLRFAPEVAHSVTKVEWHHTQRVTLEKDGSAIVEFRVDGLGEIIRWILSYGDQVQVLTPKILRQKVIRIVQKMLRTDQGESLVT